jgi:putative flippase GtrA
MTRVTAALHQTDRKEVARFFKFAVVGTIGAVVDFAVLNFLVLVVGLTPLQANPISFTCAVLSNFTWNRLWTFPESRKFKKRSQLPKFFAVNLIGLLINQVVLAVALTILEPYVPHPWDYNLAKAAAICIVLFWNFGVNRLWTYRGI